METKELEDRVNLLEETVEKLTVVVNLHAFRLGETHFEFKNHVHSGDEELPSLLIDENVREFKDDPMRAILGKYRNLFCPPGEKDDPLE